MSFQFAVGALLECAGNGFLRNLGSWIALAVRDRLTVAEPQLHHEAYAGGRRQHYVDGEKHEGGIQRRGLGESEPIQEKHGGSLADTQVHERDRRYQELREEDE